MPTTHKPRAGSLQFWPRKRVKKILPSLNWRILEKKNPNISGILGILGHKAGMARAIVRDLTPDSLTKNKQVIIPITFIECPSLKILSVRFYKNGRVVKEVLNQGLDKKLKSKIKLSKKEIKTEEIIEEIEKQGNFDDLRVIIYSVIRKTKLKKTPDIVEIGLSGKIEDKLSFVKENLNKEIDSKLLFEQLKLVDVVGTTKAHGFQGPVKRFGIGLKDHKSEKGRRRPGSLGPWTPSRVRFSAPMAGQHGFFNRRNVNMTIVKFEDSLKENIEFKHYGKINTNYVILKGSVQGPKKRQLLLTVPLRARARAFKEKFELIKIIK